MSNDQTYYRFKHDSQHVDQHTGGKWLIHGPNAARKISCKARNSHVEYPSRECKRDTKQSEGNTFNPMFKENAQGGNIQGVAHLQNK